MSDTLRKYLADDPEAWRELSAKQRANVLGTYVVDLEKQVERLQTQVEELIDDVIHMEDRL